MLLRGSYLRCVELPQLECYEMSCLRIIVQMYVFRGALAIATWLERPITGSAVDIPCLTYFKLMLGSTHAVESKLERVKLLASWRPEAPVTPTATWHDRPYISKTV